VKVAEFILYVLALLAGLYGAWLVLNDYRDERRSLRNLTSRVARPEPRESLEDMAKGILETGRRDHLRTFASIILSVLAGSAADLLGLMR
jgi:hypothetical protein